MSCILLQGKKKTHRIGTHTETNTHVIEPTHMHRNACTQAFFRTCRIRRACTDDLMQTSWILTVSVPPLVFKHKRPVSIWLPHKITRLYLQAIDLHSSVPPQDFHCSDQLYSGPASPRGLAPLTSPPRVTAFQDRFHICTAFFETFSATLFM